MINDTVRIDDGIQIKGVVTGNDAEGNIYNEIALQDETGGILVCIAQGGLCGQMQVGQEVLIDLGGLYIGAYRSQPQIGVPYTSTSASGAKSTYPSRIARAEWQTRFKLIGKPDATKLVAKEFDYESLKGNETELYKYAGCLVKATGVGFAKADGKTTYAPKSEGASTGYGVMRAFKNMTTGKDYTTNEFGVRTSCYSDFAAEKLARRQAHRNRYPDMLQVANKIQSHGADLDASAVGRSADGRISLADETSIHISY